jgi:hypothetical protein
MIGKFHLSIFAILILFSMQTADDCSDFILAVLSPRDIVGVGKDSNDASLEAAGLVVQSLDASEGLEKRVDEAVTKKDVKQLEQVMQDRPNDAHLYWLRLGMYVADGSGAAATVALSQALAVTLKNSGKTDRNDPGYRNDVQLGLLNAFAQLLPHYPPGERGATDLRTVYCQQLADYRSKPSAGDFLAIASLPSC